MTKITQSTLDFLTNLKSNNNREWFNENKLSFKKAKQEFEDFIDSLILQIIKFDPSVSHCTAKTCVFRIYRDIRFSNDKSPFKVNFGAMITSAMSKSEIHSRAGYYLHIEPGGASMLAGGAYLPQGEWLKEIRQEIDYNGAELRKIISHKSFKEYFGEIEGEKLKNPPRGYSNDHPDIELIKLKSYLAVHICPDKQVLADDFINHCSKVCKALYPLNQFLNRVLDL